MTEDEIPNNYLGKSFALGILSALEDFASDSKNYAITQLPTDSFNVWRISPQEKKAIRDRELLVAAPLVNPLTGYEK